MRRTSRLSAHTCGPPRTLGERAMVPVFSTSKGVAAVALAVLHARGLLDHDERVAAYWSEFVAAGKGDIAVRQLLAHQAGLAVIDRPLGLGDLTGSGTLATACRAASRMGAGLSGWLPWPVVGLVRERAHQPDQPWQTSYRPVLRRRGCDGAGARLPLRSAAGH
ncbi:serine hydrolase [Streptomyces ambofaciens]